MLGKLQLKTLGLGLKPCEEIEKGLKSASALKLVQGLTLSVVAVGISSGRMQLQLEVQLSRSRQIL